MLPAALPRPDALAMVPAELAPMSGLRAAKDSWIEVVATSPATIAMIMVLRIAISLFARGGLKPLDELNDDQVDRAGDQKRHGEIETLQFITARSSIAASSKSKRAAMSSASPNNSHSRS
jgi:hypothetical protein